MAHRPSDVSRRPAQAAQPAGLWILDAETTHAFEVRAGSRAVVIPPGRTVESLMQAVSQSLDTAVVALRQMPSDRASWDAAAPLGGLDGVIALLQQARGINDVAYETLVEAAIDLVHD